MNTNLPLVPVNYIGAAFPTFEPQGDYLNGLIVKAGEATETTTLLASMDGVVGQDFKDDLLAIRTKTLISTLLKAAAAYGIDKAVEKQDWWVRLAVKIVTSALQAAMNIADTRTWTTLPKEYQFCRIATPADGKIELAAPSGSPKREVIVDQTTANLILVRSITANSQFLVSQVKLTPSAAVTVNMSTVAPAERPTVHETAVDNVVVEAPPPPGRPVIEALEQRQAPASSATKKPTVAPSEVSGTTVQASTTIEPARSAPANPINQPSKPKAEQLAELNGLYRKNQITPDEYHRRRAEIVANSK